MNTTWRYPAVCAAALIFAGSLTLSWAPAAQATICGSVGGRHVDVSGCSDPFYELNDALPPPGAPPPAYVPPPPPPPPNISVCANVGRRVSISGCV